MDQRFRLGVDFRGHDSSAQFYERQQFIPLMPIFVYRTSMEITAQDLLNNPNILLSLKGNPSTRMYFSSFEI